MVLFLTVSGIMLRGGEAEDGKLFQSIKKANIDELQEAIKSGANVDLSDPNGTTVLMMASAFGQTETVRKLLEGGAKPDLQDGNGNTALMTACKNNRLDVVKLLLEYKADLNLKNNDGDRCLEIAAGKGFAEITKMFVEKAASFPVAPSLFTAAGKCKDIGTLKLLREGFGYDPAFEKEINNQLDRITGKNGKSVGWGKILTFILLAGIVFFISLRVYKRSKSMKNTLIWGTCGVLACMVMISVIHMIRNVYSDISLNNALNKVESLSIEEIRPPAIPDKDNAAVELNNAFVLMSSPKKPFVANSGSGTIDHEISKIFSDLSGPQSKTMLSWLKNLSESRRNEISSIIYSGRFSSIFQILEKAAEKPSYNFNLKYENGRDLLLSHLRYLRVAVRFLMAKAFFDAERGSPDMAYKDILTSVKLSEYLQNEPVLISSILIRANLVITAYFINYMIEKYGISENNAQQLLAELQKVNIPESTRKAILADKIMCGIPLFKMALNNEKMPDNDLAKKLENVSAATIKQDFAFYLNTMSEMAGWSSLFPKERARRADAIQIPKEFIISETMIPKGIFSKESLIMTSISTCEANLGIEIYKSKHGKYPDSLKDMVPAIFPEVPMDYTMEKELDYKKGQLIIK